MVEKNGVNSRQARRQEKEAKTKQGKEKTKKEKVRLFPIWARLLLIFLLVLISLSLGLMVGYGVIGNGEATDILKPSLWDKLIDLVLAGT